MSMGIPHAIHELKTWPEQYDLVNGGDKTLELRREDDKRFEPKDVLWLREYVPTELEWHAVLGDEPYPYDESWEPGNFTGQERWVWVTDVLRGWGLLPGWAALSIVRVRLEATH